MNPDVLSDGQMMEMCRYLEENPEATEQEIVDVAYSISRRNI